MKKIFLIVLIGFLLFSVIALSLVYAVDDSPIKQAWHVYCANGDDFWHYGSEEALYHRMEAICGR